MNATLIQIYNGVTDKTGDVITVESALNRIKNGTYKQEIERLRNEPDKTKRDTLKKKLPAVTWSGTFGQRNAKNLLEYSNIICIDIDKLSESELLRIDDILSINDFVYAYFVSPSGNGFKILFKTSVPYLPYTQHQKIFICIENYFKNNFDIEVDTSGKDVNRLCFLSYDEHLYINENCTILDVDFVEKYEPKKEITEKKPTTKTVKKVAQERTEKTTQQQLDDVATFTNNKLTYVDGERNNYVHLFACNANRKGIDYSDTLDYCFSYFGHDLDVQEITATVKSAYQHNTHEIGKYAPQNNAPAAKKSLPTYTPEIEEIETPTTHDIDDKVLFWYEEITKEKNGKEKKTIKFSYDDGTRFLERNGFFKIPMDNNNYQFIRIKDNVIDIVKERNMREFMLSYLETDYWNFKNVREMFKRGAKMYSSTQYLECLPFYYPKFKKDTEHTAFIYFNNCYLEIDKDKIEQNKYNALTGNIWSKQINNFELEFCDYQNCYFDEFLQLAILGRKPATIEDFTDLETKKIQSVMSTIGYLLHRYKDPANPKVVVGVDKKMRTGNDDNGGSGKSLFSKAISKLIHTCIIDGKNFKFDAPYPFEKLNLDHSLINFNDVTKNFDFERLFGLITEEFTYSKKYIDAITISYEDSPKMYISTNKSIKGGGASFMRRQHVIEFTDYFNDSHSPQKEFGHMFFSHWDNNEWNQFYLFLIHCLQFYLKYGLVEFPLENYGLNKLIDTAGDEFVDYMNDTVLTQMVFTTEFKVKELYDGFIKLVAGTFREKTQQNTFSKNVKGWCELNNLEINAHKPADDKRDRRNGIDYWTFTVKPD